MLFIPFTVDIPKRFPKRVIEFISGMIGVFLYSFIYLEMRDVMFRLRPTPPEFSYIHVVNVTFAVITATAIYVVIAFLILQLAYILVLSNLYQENNDLDHIKK